MRDLVVREALRAMARDAGDRFAELIASGEEIPYDVREAGDGSPLPQYVPLTGRFIRDHTASLRELDSFGAACAAIASAELDGPYLEEMEIPVPPDARKRAELACAVFLCRLWWDSTDFSISDERLASGINEMEAGADAGVDEIEVIVPLRGLHLPVARLELATATLVRADTVEVPPEARAGEGSGSAAWEPAYLAVARIGSPPPGEEADESAPDAGARAVEAFRQLITALRLFKAGGVGLGPYAWTRSGSHRWRRIATGAGRPRPGGYRLAETELGDLVAFSRTLANRSTPFGRPARGRPGLAGALARAISRFEVGLERHAVIDALNDYLLTLRFVLEGGGPADLGLAMRVAALCSEPERRGETKSVVDRALSLERELWSGEPAPADAPGPAQTAATIEELTRAILKDAACGHLGGDLRATADEILLADGLAVGEGEATQRGETSEWDVVPGDGDLPLGDEQPDEAEETLPGPQPEPLAGIPEEPVQEDLWVDAYDGDPEPREEPHRLKVPEPAGRIRVEHAPAGQPEEELVIARSTAQLSRVDEPPTGVFEASAPAREPEPPAERRREDRVAYLFPRPETTEWNVRELAYDRSRRAETDEVRAS
jgi:hypothetical protein